LRYPDLAEYVGPDVGGDYFALAELYCDNTSGGGGVVTIDGMVYSGRWCGSVVTDIPTRQRLLGLMTAHIARLLSSVGGSPASTLVGRISSAGEGSVNVATEFPLNPESAWFNQTKEGAMFWAATARYRMARYYPGPRLNRSFFSGRGRF
jgi:hypothetical protein